MATNGFSKRGYVLVLGCSLACATLVAWHLGNRSQEIRRRMFSLRSELEPIQFEVLTLNLYRQEINQAKDLLRSGNHQDAIAKLEDTIELARMLGVIPLIEGDVPGNDEMLLMSLYYQAALQGRVPDGMQEFWIYMVSAYPSFSMESLDSWSRVLTKRYSEQSGSRGALEGKTGPFMENAAR